MKKSMSNLQTTIVLASVLSAALLFSVVFSFNGYHTQMAEAKKNHHYNVSSISSSGSGDTTPDNTATTTITPSGAQQQQQQRNDGIILPIS